MLSFQQKDGSFNGPLTQLDILEHTAEISHFSPSLRRIDDLPWFFFGIHMDPKNWMMRP